MREATVYLKSTDITNVKIKDIIEIVKSDDVYLVKSERNIFRFPIVNVLFINEERH